MKTREALAFVFGEDVHQKMRLLDSAGLKEFYELQNNFWRKMSKDEAPYVSELSSEAQEAYKAFFLFVGEIKKPVLRSPNPGPPSRKLIPNKSGVPAMFEKGLLPLA